MNFWSLIQESVKDKFNQISHTRISSYIILITITINAFVFMGIDIYNATLSAGKYIIPMDHIVIFGMVLAHHLTLVGLKRNSETKQTRIEHDGLVSSIKSNITDMKSTDNTQTENLDNQSIDENVVLEEPKKED